MDYRILCSESGVLWQGVRELSQIPEAVANPGSGSKQEQGLINLVIPMLDGQAEDVEKLVVKFKEFQRLPIAKTMAGIGRIFKLYIIQGKEVIIKETSGDPDVMIVQDQHISGMSRVEAFVKGMRLAMRRSKREEDSGSIWMWFSSPPIRIGTSASAFFTSLMFNRIRLNTVQGEQALILHPLVDYHPDLMQYHIRNKERKPDISIDGDVSHFESLDRIIVTFYGSDFKAAVAHTDASRISSIKDLFKDTLTLIEVPEPTITLRYRDNADNWAAQLSSRSQKGKILLDWIKHHADSGQGPLPSFLKD